VKKSKAHAEEAFTALGGYDHKYSESQEWKRRKYNAAALCYLAEWISNIFIYGIERGFSKQLLLLAKSPAL
jgi:hypothetical protein